MDFDDVLKNRRTIRRYTEKKVTDNQIEELLNSAILAPSAKNRQPWRFYILSDTEKDDIVQMMYEWDEKNKKEKTSVKGTANQMKEANKVIFVYYPIYKNKIKRFYYRKPDYLSIGAAIENLILKCVDMDLGSCWCCDTLYMDEEINKYLKIEGYEQISSILIGYPKEIPEKSPRLNLEELMVEKEG